VIINSKIIMEDGVMTTVGIMEIMSWLWEQKRIPEKNPTSTLNS